MVGIGGAGMSGIAEVLLNLGYEVTGSDLSENEAVRHLKAMGALIYKGHSPEHLGQAEVLVRSTAVTEANPEVLTAKKSGIPVIPRAEMLAELMRLKTGIAVAGTHGKTTTTSLLGTVFKEAGFDPTVIIGGRLNQYGSNALMGQGEYLIAEADESDGSFLCLAPIMTVVTNVDADHLDFYPNMTSIEEAFLRFMNHVPFYGINVVCGDDPVLGRLLSKVKRPVVTYGLGPENDVRGSILEQSIHTRVLVSWKDSYWGEVEVSLPGVHNVLNALAVVAVCIQAEIQRESVVQGFQCFGGVGRRLEQKGQRDGIVLFDDYGHHPTEIRVTLKTLRHLYPDKRLVVLFQAHRFSRTKALFGAFCKAFADSDILIVTEIYPAAEDPIPGINGLTLTHGLRQVGHKNVSYCSDAAQCLACLKEVSQPGDIVLTLGAGNVWKIGESFLSAA
jgi:UDP-N-acetylmuramate--alanine ligase